MSPPSFLYTYATCVLAPEINPKDPVSLNLFTQKDLILAIEKAERRIKREKKQKAKFAENQ